MAVFRVKGTLYGAEKFKLKKYIKLILTKIAVVMTACASPYLATCGGFASPTI